MAGPADRRSRLGNGPVHERPDTGTATVCPPVDRQRRAYFADTGWVSAPHHRGDQLRPGSTVEGPAIVSEPTSTIVVHPGTTLTTTPYDNYLLEVDAHA